MNEGSRLLILFDSDELRDQFVSWLIDSGEQMYHQDCTMRDEPSGNFYEMETGVLSFDSDEDDDESEDEEPEPDPEPTPEEPAADAPGEPAEDEDDETPLIEQGGIMGWWARYHAMHGRRV